MDLAFEDDDRLVPVEMPAEGSGGAVPEGRERGIVRAADVLGGARHRVSFEDPIRFDGRIPHLKVACPFADGRHALLRRGIVRGCTSRRHGDGTGNE